MVLTNEKKRVIKGKVISLNISKRKGTVKTPVESVELIENYGIKGDAHAGKWHRQVSMLSIKTIKKMRNMGINLNFGDLAENITVDIEDIHKLPVGGIVKIRDVIMEITQIGKQCHDQCEIRRKVGVCLMPAEGIFLRVLKGGKIEVGDEITLILD